MLHLIEHTLLDALKLLPFLFLSYLIIEFIEHKSSQKINKTLKNSGKFGPIIGSILGCFPQCGFSVTAASLYASRVITLGTLISVFLATSDEAIPVLLSHPESAGQIFKILLTKLIIGIIMGMVIDFVFRKKQNKKDQTVEIHEHAHEMCRHCDCEHGIFKSAIKHTINTFIFVLIVYFLINGAIHLIGEDNLSKVLMSGSIFQPFIAGLIGLIPNCASSVVLTELFIAGNLSFGSIIAGLCTGAGIGMMVLFKENKNMKENIKILGLVYLIGSLSGVIIELIGIV